MILFESTQAQSSKLYFGSQIEFKEDGSRFDGQDDLSFRKGGCDSAGISETVLKNVKKSHCDAGSAEAITNF